MFYLCGRFVRFLRYIRSAGRFFEAFVLMGLGVRLGSGVDFGDGIETFGFRLFGFGFLTRA